MARPELGTKRTCPETGRKFYDLNRDPVVSPYTGVSYPLSYFEGGVRSLPEVEPEEEVEETVASPDVELVSLEDAEPTEKKASSDADPDIDLEDDADDPFLPDDEESDDDVSGLIDGDIESDEDT
ncbi:MAG: TIGR02300 family protein [Salinarimonas sp.]|nr:TIGR02300 family protein [Salinarimonas sp.]